MYDFNRRRVLRGMLGGGAVTVGLPLLNVFLNGNGNAMADGRPMPVRFGTWYWALGIAKAAFVPGKTGATYDFKPEMEALKPVKDHFNVLTNFTAFRDNAPNLCHFSGWVINRTGAAPMTSGNIPGETRTASLAIYDAIQANRESDAWGMIAVLSGLAIATLYAVNKLTQKPHEG